jgi:hypothetical protein
MRSTRLCLDVKRVIPENSEPRAYSLKAPTANMPLLLLFLKELVRSRIGCYNSFIITSLLDRQDKTKDNLLSVSVPDW